MAGGEKGKWMVDDGIERVDDKEREGWRERERDAKAKE